MIDKARSARIWSDAPSPQSGHKGVCWHRTVEKWRARATSPKSGRQVSLGLHDTVEAAVAAIKDYLNLFDH